MKKIMTLCAIVGMILMVSSPAFATTVALVPGTQDAAPGDTVNVSVYMTITESIAMTAISAEFIYNADVFTFVNLTQGALLIQDFGLMGNQNPPLRVGGFTYPAESLELGAGTLFTFTLKVDDNAPLGSYDLVWGVVDGGTGQGAGLCYGDENFIDIVVPSSGASINIVPEPATMALLGLGALFCRKFKKA